MKYFSIIISILLLTSCEKEYYWEYEIKNETNHNISITCYDRYNLNNIRYENIFSLAECINIEPNKNWSVIRLRGFQPDPSGIFENWEIDSVNIVFDNQKVIVQFCNEYNFLELCPIERNITAYDTEYKKVKTGRRSGENEYRFTYTITEEDYNNAVEIEK